MNISIKIIPIILSAFLSISAIYSQSNPILDIEGVSKLRGTMYLSDSLDLSTIDIRSNIDPVQSSPFDSAEYYFNLLKGNTLIGLISDSISLLRLSSTLGFLAGTDQVGEENISIGYASSFDSDGDRNIAIGSHAGNFTIGDDNIVIGNMENPYDQIGGPTSRNYNKNIIIGNQAGKRMTGSENIVIGYNAGPDRLYSNNLFIGTSGHSTTPLIGGSFSSKEVDINGTLHISESVIIDENIELNGSITDPFGDIEIIDDLILSTEDGTSRSLRLVEENNNNEFGFKLNYNGLKDRLELSTLGFLGNKGIRSIWTKSGKMGIGNLTPLTSLHVATGTDVKNDAGGYLTIGSNTNNIAIDDNEIMARTNTNQPNGLYLNNNGGEVVVGSRLRLAFSNVDTPANEEGQMRYNKTTDDFEGYDGTTWYSLTSNKASFASSRSGSSTKSKESTPTKMSKLIFQNATLEKRIERLESIIEELTKESLEE